MEVPPIVVGSLAGDWATNLSCFTRLDYNFERGGQSDAWMADIEIKVTMWRTKIITASHLMRCFGLFTLI